MVREEYSVSMKSIVEEQGLTVLHAAKDFDSARVYTADVNRPALQQLLADAENGRIDKIMVYRLDRISR